MQRCVHLFIVKKWNNNNFGESSHDPVTIQRFCFLIRYGIHPVLDMHQDVFNRRFCGNGVPDWVPQPDEFNFPYPIEVEYEVDESGYPSRYLESMIVTMVKSIM